MTTRPATATAAQTEAINAQDALVVVEGCAGSGKKRVLCGHVHWLTLPRKGGNYIDRRRIWITTFTHETAESIRAALQKRDPQGKWEDTPHGNLFDGFIGTHHKFMLRLANQYRSRLGYQKEIHFINHKDYERRKREARSAVLQEGERNNQDWKSTEERAEDWLEIKLRKEGLAHYHQLRRDVTSLLKDATVQKDLAAHNAVVHVVESEELSDKDYEVYAALTARQKFIVGNSAAQVYKFSSLDDGTVLTKFQDHPDAHNIILRTNFRCMHKVCIATNQLLYMHRPRLKNYESEPIKIGDPSESFIFHHEGKGTEGQQEQTVELILKYAKLEEGGYWFNQIAIIWKTFQAGLTGIQRKLQAADIPFEMVEMHKASEQQPRVSNAVQILRVEQCKNHTFNHVIIPFCTRQEWPGKDDANLARRQLAVAMTRARKTVHLLYCKATAQDLYLQEGRPVKGPESELITVPSIFLKEMNENILVVETQ